MINRPNAVNLSPQNHPTFNTITPNPNLYAIIINGDADDRFKNDASAIYCTLIQEYGYLKENIYVHAADYFDMDGDGTASGDFDFYATKNNILNTLNEMNGNSKTPNDDIPELGPEDQLFVFISAHGEMNNGNSEVFLPSSPSLTDIELSEQLEEIKSSQIICVVMACEAGGFYTKLIDTNDAICKNRSVHTSSNEGPSWWEYWLTNGNFNEFVYYWTAAARGAFPETYAPWNTVESFDFSTIITGHPGEVVKDLNGDGIVQMEEAFNYANDMDTWSEYGIYIPNENIGSDGDEPEDYEPEVPLHTTDISFEDDLLSLKGICGLTEGIQSIDNRNYMIGGELILDNNLIVEENANIYLSGAESKITVNTGEDLILEANVDITGNNGGAIFVYGDITFGSNCVINNLPGLYISNQSPNISINNVSFINSLFENQSDKLDVINCIFNNCYVYSYKGDVVFDNCAFNTSWFVLSSAYSEYNKLARITNCTFTSVLARPGINIDDYDNFIISGNDMNGMFNGVQMNNCGYGTGSHIFEHNTIYNSFNAALNLYNTISKIKDNYLYNNNKGIALFNNCHSAILGNSGANYYYETQRIIDNGGYEILIADGNSFPWYIKYNLIQDNDNSGGESDALVYYYTNGKSALGDIKHNCWGNGFNATVDLYPVSFYNYLPTWCPGGGSIPIGVAEALYLQGQTQISNLEYLNAKETFEMVIEQYPSTRYADAAMKDLLAVEQYVNNDYLNLQLYYQNNENIQNDTMLSILAKSLANKCNEQIGNWQLAINHYEELIQRPPSFADSIYAIIDLGHLYLLIESDSLLKSTSITGAMKEYVPESKIKFREKQEYLLTLLPHYKKENQSPKKNSSIGILGQNSPNPFSGITTIDIFLEKTSKCELEICDISGRIIRNFHLNMDQGRQQIELKLENEPNGLYYYSLYIDGGFYESKKMILIR